MNVSREEGEEEEVTDVKFSINTTEEREMDDELTGKCNAQWFIVIFDDDRARATRENINYVDFDVFGCGTSREPAKFAVVNLMSC